VFRRACRGFATFIGALYKEDVIVPIIVYYILDMQIEDMSSPPVVDEDVRHSRFITFKDISMPVYAYSLTRGSMTV